ncbi:MAG TPA: hypothetical protein DCX65_10035 [Spirochaetaceae bacterium]|nr:hypothetical protein [Spirochaetaceae bacterium]
MVNRQSLHGIGRLVRLTLAASCLAITFLACDDIHLLPEDYAAGLADLMDTQVTRQVRLDMDEAFGLARLGDELLVIGRDRVLRFPANLSEPVVYLATLGQLLDNAGQISGMSWQASASTVGDDQVILLLNRFNGQQVFLFDSGHTALASAFPSFSIPLDNLTGVHNFFYPPAPPAAAPQQAPWVLKITPTGEAQRWNEVDPPGTTIPLPLPAGAMALAGTATSQGIRVLSQLASDGIRRDLVISAYPTNVVIAGIAIEMEASRVDSPTLRLPLSMPEGQTLMPFAVFEEADFYLIYCYANTASVVAVLYLKGQTATAAYDPSAYLMTNERISVHGTDRLYSLLAHNNQLLLCEARWPQ